MTIFSVLLQKQKSLQKSQDSLRSIANQVEMLPHLENMSQLSDDDSLWARVTGYTNVSELPPWRWLAGLSPLAWSFTEGSSFGAGFPDGSGGFSSSGDRPADSRTSLSGSQRGSSTDGSLTSIEEERSDSLRVEGRSTTSTLLASDQQSKASTPREERHEDDEHRSTGSSARSQEKSSQAADVDDESGNSQCVDDDSNRGQDVTAKGRQEEKTAPSSAATLSGGEDEGLHDEGIRIRSSSFRAPKPMQGHLDLPL